MTNPLVIRNPPSSSIVLVIGICMYVFYITYVFILFTIKTQGKLFTFLTITHQASRKDSGVKSLRIENLDVIIYLFQCSSIH